MLVLRITNEGDFNKTIGFLEKAEKTLTKSSLDEYGRLGVDALTKATPKNTGKTAASWYYEIEKKNDSIAIVWSNSNINENVNVAVLIQMGHGTGTGGYVRGVDYINPALKPVFDKIANDVWKEVER